MKYWKPALSLLFLLICWLVPQSAFAQGGLQQSQIDVQRDPQAEQDAKHNLEVSRFYMKRKAYKGVTDRLLEVIYVYPQFSRMDEVLALLGEAFLKQDNKTEAAKFYKRLVDDFPESRFVKDAKQKLASLPAVTADTSGK